MPSCTVFRKRPAPPSAKMDVARGGHPAGRVSVWNCGTWEKQAEYTAASLRTPVADIHFTRDGSRLVYLQPGAVGRGLLCEFRPTTLDARLWKEIPTTHPFVVRATGLRRDGKWLAVAPCPERRQHIHGYTCAARIPARRGRQQAVVWDLLSDTTLCNIHSGPRRSRGG